jgi:hypothetical protein
MYSLHQKLDYVSILMPEHEVEPEHVLSLFFIPLLEQVIAVAYNFVLAV